MDRTESHLKIAVLLNGFESPSTALLRASFKSSISLACSVSPTIEFFDPIIAQSYPDPAKYDLIILSGGTADPMGHDPWVLRMQSFLRTTVAQFPQKKILGICWGHQTICVTFGGKVGAMDSAEVGVTSIKMTDKGRQMLPFTENGTLQIHEFHRRDVKIPARGFFPMAEGQQSFLNDNNSIWTFQGHPELNTELAITMLQNASSYMGISEAQRDGLMESMNKKHDGLKIWKRILAWVKE